MRPYGQRMGANDYDGSDLPVAVVQRKSARAEGKRQCNEGRAAWMEWRAARDELSTPSARETP